MRHANSKRVSPYVLRSQAGGGDDVTAEELASRAYVVVVKRDEYTNGQPCYVAFSPEVRYCYGSGITTQAAIADLLSARIDLFQSLLDDGIPIPEPMALGSETVAINLDAPWRREVITK